MGRSRAGRGTGRGAARWCAGTVAAGLCLAAGAFAGRDTVAAMDPWYRQQPLVRLPPAALPTFGPTYAPAAVAAPMPTAAPIRAAGWATAPVPLDEPRFEDEAPPAAEPAPDPLALPEPDYPDLLSAVRAVATPEPTPEPAPEPAGEEAAW